MKLEIVRRNENIVKGEVASVQVHYKLFNDDYKSMHNGFIETENRASDIAKLKQIVRVNGILREKGCWGYKEREPPLDYGTASIHMLLFYQLSTYRLKSWTKSYNVLIRILSGWLAYSLLHKLSVLFPGQSFLSDRGTFFLEKTPA
ncbi:hypothetical protein J6TS1_06900 [Siminovitchia terrae]|uniref:Uncharacterized protein n=1 Tax=Siminovitchia terrae TaxID=1914933 RepID=A0ABQ4KS49_SIMTE|nr:hypothetical protein [Siminovitchia terrae]GIN94820.1 hypothetical protein J6TS1_06900 [Siminovitchia terrae]